MHSKQEAMMKHSLRNILLLLAGIMIMLGMSGCATQKYKLNFNSDGFKASRPAYAAGERVTVYYNLIGTDTDYKFDVEGVEWTQDYDPAKGYILRFVCVKQSLCFIVVDLAVIDRKS